MQQGKTDGLMYKPPAHARYCQQRTPTIQSNNFITLRAACAHLRTTMVVLTGLADTIVKFLSSTLPVLLISTMPSSSGW